MGGNKLTSRGSYFAGVLPKYFSSEWSVAQFRLAEGLQHIVAFGHQKNTVVILGMDGRYDYAFPLYEFIKHMNQVSLVNSLFWTSSLSGSCSINLLSSLACYGQPR